MTDLKLLALDNEDLQIISAHSQDAVVRVGDMGYARRDKRFALLMNRFDWETGITRRKGQRKRTAMHFDRVEAVATSGFDIHARDGVLELLAITFTEGDSPAGVLELSFAGGATVRLTVECVEVRLQDLGSAWAAKHLPEHTLDERSV